MEVNAYLPDSIRRYFFGTPHDHLSPGILDADIQRQTAAEFLLFFLIRLHLQTMAQPNELAYLLSSELDLRETLLALNHEYDTLPPSIFTVTETMDIPAAPFAGGRYGDVYRVKRDDSYLAFKVLRGFNHDASVRKMFGREAIMLASMNHQSILPFLRLDPSAFAPHIAIVTPWCTNGTAVQFLSRPCNYPMRVQIISQIAEGLSYLHSRDVIHGDLRGSNILIDEDCHVRLSDFGLSELGNGRIRGSTRIMGNSYRWAAPEILCPVDRLNNKSFATDIYSLACACLEIYTGRNPFYGVTNEHVAVRVVLGDRPTRPTDENGGGDLIPDEMWAIIEHCWAQEPALRPSAETVVQRVWTLLH